MLPSMPVLFNRESQDAFGNRIEPSTSFFSQNLTIKPIITAQPPLSRPDLEPPKVLGKETKTKSNPKKKESPPEVNAEALELALIKSYHSKVQSRFNTNVFSPSNKFVKFRDILKSFDPLTETPAQLFRKIESLFADENKDLVEEFLLFLKPGQATEVGRFMDHFMLVQMTGFIQLLQTTLSRKPTVLRKVLRTLTAGINGGSVAEMKAKIYPHLRSNPKLWKMLLSLIPEETPPDSLYDAGVSTLPEEILTCDKNYDIWEFEGAEPNTKKIENSDTLNTYYHNGRVFLQRGGILRNASVTYPYSKEPYRAHIRRLAPVHCHLSPPTSEDETTSPKRNSRTNKTATKRTRKQIKSPTKLSKDVNDNTKKDTINLTSPRSTKTKISTKNKTKVETKTEQTQKKDKKTDNKNNIVNPKKEEYSKVKKVKLELPTENIKVKTVRFSNLITKDNLKKVELKNVSWTRDEDKTMLQVLKGEAGSEQVFGKIMELLPHRSAAEIKDRYQHVMNLLQQMAVGDVT